MTKAVEAKYDTFIFEAAASHAALAFRGIGGRRRLSGARSTTPPAR